MKKKNRTLFIKLVLPNIFDSVVLTICSIIYVKISLLFDMCEKLGDIIESNGVWVVVALFLNCYVLGFTIAEIVTAHIEYFKRFRHNAN